MNPAERGAYVLVMRVDSGVCIRVGSLGLLSFTAGWYVYVGSALNGLSARVGRHLRLRKAIRWHIDYLRPAADRVSAFLFPSHRDIECVLAQELRGISGDQVARFGSSDCTCFSHLFYFDRNPILMEDFRLFLDGNGGSLRRPAAGDFCRGITQTARETKRLSS